MKKTTRALSAFAMTAGVLGATLLAPPVGSAAAAPVANPDRLTVVEGASAQVAVLANDKRTSGAKVAIVKAPAGVKASVTGARKVRIVAGSVAATRTVQVRYSLTRSGVKDVTTIAVTIRNKAVTPTNPGSGDPSSLRAATRAMPVATESRTGYDRDLFKHWNAGLSATDGCDTRREVLRAEAVIKPSVGSSCSFTGGSWTSYYDGANTGDSSTFDIDHMVPLAEAWDSGASTWTAARREAYANDQGDPRSLVAVTANSNRSKGDQDPGEWQPLLERCRYAAEWTATKYRWTLSVDTTEKAALVELANACPEATVSYTVVP